MTRGPDSQGDVTGATRRCVKRRADSYGIRLKRRCVTPTVREDLVSSRAMAGRRSGDDRLSDGSVIIRIPYEPVDAPLHDVAAAVGDRVEVGLPPRPVRPPGSLGASLRDGVGDAPPPQQGPAGRIGVPLVGDQVVGSRPGPTRPGPRHPDRVEHRRQLGAVVALPRCQDHGQWATLPVAGQVELGAQPASVPPDRLVTWRGGTVRGRRRTSPFWSPIGGGVAQLRRVTVPAVSRRLISYPVKLRRGSIARGVGVRYPAS